MITLYGIPNCDTVRKARKCLDAHQVNYQFIDFRKDDFSIKDLQAWLNLSDFNAFLNPKSTAWKQLTEQQVLAVKEQHDLGLLIEYPTLIKRPVLVTDQDILFGFDEVRYQSLITSIA